MFSLLRTMAVCFLGGMAALAALICVFSNDGWVLLLALGALGAVVSPWQKRWQQREREYQDALRALHKPPR